ncbi:hypothetical protein ACKVMT_16825 [Halobacteriales archaeon Cl-PHB]
MSHSLSPTGSTQRHGDSRTEHFAGSLAAYVVMAALLLVVLLVASYPTLAAGLLASLGLVSVAFRRD